jgi:hypothetical protein
MEKATKRQIVSGLRIGSALGVFLIATILMSQGLARILGLEGSHPTAWTDWIGWIELSIAAVMLVLTARTWLVLVGGYMLFGAIKGAFLFASGNFPYHGFSTRVEPLELAIYGVLTLALLYRFAENPPTVLERVALTAYWFCFLYPSYGPTFALSRSQMIGLAILLAAWGVSRWRAPRPSQRTLRL